MVWSRVFSSQPRSIAPAPDAPVTLTWYGVDQCARVRGFVVPRGMVYIGPVSSSASCPGVPSHGIDPNLAVATANPHWRCGDMGEAPSYTEMRPEERLAFLLWLSRGAEHKEAGPGLTRCYLRGLGHRLLQDSPSHAEASALNQEVERLRRLYAGHVKLIETSNSLFRFLRHAEEKDDPVQVARSAPGTAHRIPVQVQRTVPAISAPTSLRAKSFIPPPVKPGLAHWTPPGQAVTVHGYTISAGMVYVGESMPALAVTEAWSLRAPYLIDPELPLGPAPHAIALPMWVESYSGMSPGLRRAYLQWMASGRLAGAPPQFPWMHVLAIERRLFDPKVEAAEIMALQVELRRVEQAFPGADWLRASLDSAQRLAALRHEMGLTAEDRTWVFSLETLVRHGSAPPQLRLALAGRIASGLPLPFELALGGYLASERGQLRAIPRVVWPEFEVLARSRFEHAFPRGWTPTIYPRGNLRLTHTSAASGTPIPISLAELPAPESVESWGSVEALVERARVDLMPYARALGGNRMEAGSVKALLKLPAELAHLDPDHRLDAVAAHVAALPAGCPVSVSDLAPLVTGPGESFGAARLQERIALSLARRGWGIEPDPGLGGSISAVIWSFRVEGEINEESTIRAAPTETEAATAFAVHLGAVAGLPIVLGQAWPEWVAVLARLEQAGSVWSARIAARARWLATRRGGVAEMRRIGFAMTPAVRVAILERMVLAALGTGATPETVDVTRALERVCDLIGAERAVVYRVLHSGTALRAGSATQLDLDRLRAVAAETSQVSTALAAVFQDEIELEPSSKEGESFCSVSGMDAAHGRLVQVAMARPAWTRGEFTALARAEGLMVDGAIEILNEWALDRYGEMLIEESGETIEVNQALAA